MPRHAQARRALLTIACFTLHGTAQAWGAEGHQVIAALAQAQLTPTAQQEINRLLALEPGDTLESISTWADDHRTPETGPWHYVNFPRGNCVYGNPPIFH